MAESKVQKVARQGSARKAIGACDCGGELVWAKVVFKRPRMTVVCERCGAVHEDKSLRASARTQTMLSQDIRNLREDSHAAHQVSPAS